MKIDVQWLYEGKEMVNIDFKIWLCTSKVLFDTFFFKSKIYCEVKKKMIIIKEWNKIESYLFFLHFVFHVVRPPRCVMSESWRMRCMSLVVNSISFEVNCNLTVNCSVIWVHRSFLSFGKPKRHLKKYKYTISFRLALIKVGTITRGVVKELLN